MAFFDSFIHFVDEDKAKYDERTKVLADKMFIPKEKRALVW